MKDFVAIDFETANPQRVSACAIGYAKVSDSKIIDTKGHFIKPIGGHAPFQSKIHGIKDEHTFDKPYFGDLFPEIKDVFDYPLVAHSLFDKQVLQSLSDHFNLRLKFNYIDSCAIAKEKLPNLKDCKLPTLIKYFGLPAFKHHDAKEDAMACAQVFLKLMSQDSKETLSSVCDEISEFKGILKGILADDLVNYKEAYSLLYWFEDHKKSREKYEGLYSQVKDALCDDQLDCIEATDIKTSLTHTLNELG